MNAPRTTLLALALGAAASAYAGSSGEGTLWTELAHATYPTAAPSMPATGTTAAEESIYVQLATSQREDSGRHGMAGVSGESRFTGQAARGEESIYDQLRRQH